jgi:integrase
MIQFAFQTGLRFSEMMALKLSDINFDERTIHVQRAMKRTRNRSYVEGPPKTKNSNRIIHIPSDGLWRAIATQTEIHQTLNSTYFFCMKEGELLHPPNFRSRYWMDVFKKTNLQYRSPKQTRHSFATNSLSQGETAEWTAKMMGHRNTEMIVGRYSRFVENIKKEKDGEVLSRAYDSVFG